MFHYTACGDLVDMFAWVSANMRTSPQTQLLERFEDGDYDGDNKEDHIAMVDDRTEEEKRQAEEFDDPKNDDYIMQIDPVVWELRVARRKNLWREKIEALSQAIIAYPDNLNKKIKQLEDTIKNFIDLQNEKSKPPAKDTPNVDIEDPHLLDNDDKHMMAQFAKENDQAQSTANDSSKNAANTTQQTSINMIKQHEKDFPRDKYKFAKHVEEYNSIISKLVTGSNRINDLENAKRTVETEKQQVTNRYQQDQFAYNILLPPQMTREQADNALNNMIVRMNELQEIIDKYKNKLLWFQTFRKDMDAMMSTYHKVNIAISTTPIIENTFMFTLDRAKQYIKL